MSYVLAKQEQWLKEHVHFNVIGDVYGGIWALENNEADYFLWEKYTTQPFVDKGSCKRIGQVDTPWPCFVIAVRNEVLQSDEALLKMVLSIVQARAAQLKQAPDSPEVLAWRYALKKDEVAAWLSETEWSNSSVLESSELQKTVETLLELELISSEEAKDWPTKLLG